MKAHYKNVVRYEVTAVCAQPMHIGSGENDGSVLTRESNGIPFIQGTSLAGAFRDYVEQARGDKDAAELFGGRDTSLKQNQVSHIVFSEGNFTPEKFSMEMRTRVSICGETGSVNQKKLKGAEKTSGQVLDLEYIAKGSEFSFLIYLFDGSSEIVKECLAALHKGILTLGGMGTIGCGKVRLAKVTENSYDMSKETDRAAWNGLQADGIQGTGSDILEEIKEIQPENPYYELKATIRLKTPFLIRANEVERETIQNLLTSEDAKTAPEKLPDAMPITVGSGKNVECILPGSSQKGVFRSRMETIAEYLSPDIKEKLEAAFADRSICMFEDAVITDQKTKLQPRIHINKLSGGVMYQKLFTEMTVSGKADLRILVAKESGKENALSAKQILGLLLYVLRDFQIGAVTMGSGVGIGRGYLEVETVEIADQDTCFSMQEPENAGAFVGECLKALHDDRKEAC